MSTQQPDSVDDPDHNPPDQPTRTVAAKLTPDAVRRTGPLITTEPMTCCDEAADGWDERIWRPL